MTYGRALGGVCLLRSLLLNATPADAKKASLVPFFVFVAEYDTEYIPAQMEASALAFKHAGYEITWHVEPKADHYMFSKAELYHCAAWIMRAMGKEARVTYRDADHLPADALANLPPMA